MEIIRGGGFPLDEEPIQAPLFDALASRLAPPPVARSTNNLIQLEIDPNNLPVDPEIVKLDLLHPPNLYAVFGTSTH